jgi:hypothetical protein
VTPIPIIALLAAAEAAVGPILSMPFSQVASIILVFVVIPIVVIVMFAIVNATVMVFAIVTIVTIVAITILMFIFLRSGRHAKRGWSDERGGQQQVPCYESKSSVHVNVSPVEILIPVNSKSPIRREYETIETGWMFDSAHWKVFHYRLFLERSKHPKRGHPEIERPRTLWQ